MADRIELHEGDLPWKPAGTEALTVLNKYDMPLSGIIDQHGTSYFFWCIRGEVTQGTLWGYAAIGDHERNEFSHEARDQVLRRVLSDHRPFTLAFSVEGRGLVKWRDIDDASRVQVRFRSRSPERELGLTPEEKELLDLV